MSQQESPKQMFDSQSVLHSNLLHHTSMELMMEIELLLILVEYHYWKEGLLLLVVVVDADEVFGVPSFEHNVILKWDKYGERTSQNATKRYESIGYPCSYSKA